MSKRTQNNELVDHVMRIFGCILSAMALALVSISCRAGVPSTTERSTVTLMAGQMAGNRMLEAAVQAYDAQPDFALAIRPSPGGFTNVHALQRGEADLAFAGADIAYLAFSGLLDQAAYPFDQLRGIAVLPLSPVHLIARKDSGIRSVIDLNGRRISVGGPGSAGALTSGLILDAFGVRASLHRPEMVEFNQALGEIVEGNLDAMFATVRFPDDRVMSAVRAGAYLIPIAGTPVEQLRRDYPFLKLTVIPRAMYAGLDAVHTVGVDTLLLCRKNLDEGLVYELTKRFFDAVTGLSPYQGPYVDMDLAPATPIPLHDGAARYYREQELRR